MPTVRKTVIYRHIVIFICRRPFLRIHSGKCNLTPEAASFPRNQNHKFIVEDRNITFSFRVRTFAFISGSGKSSRSSDAVADHCVCPFMNSPIFLTIGSLPSFHSEQLPRQLQFLLRREFLVEFLHVAISHIIPLWCLVYTSDAVKV